MQTKKLLNICSLFMSIIGGCSAILVCFILFIYPNLDNSNLPDNRNTAIVQTGKNPTNTTLPPSIYQEAYDSIPENDVSINYHETESLPPVTEDVIPESVNIPTEYESALKKANNYSNAMYMSKAAIYSQLTSEYGERFSSDAAQYAIDNMVADWNLNALQKAQTYSDTMCMSKNAIYNQLISEYGEKFTPSEAQYAVDNLVADFNSNALQKARDYQNTMNMSPDEIYNQLTSEYGENFTQAEANYAVTNLEPLSNKENSSVIYTMPVEQNVSSTDYIADKPIQDTVVQNPSDNSFLTYDTPESQVAVPAGEKVWLPATGKKYHRIDHCGNMNPNKAREVSHEQAINEGYEKCSNCF